MKYKKVLSRIRGAAALAACVGFAANAFAAPVSYTIDPSQSTLQLQLFVFGGAATPQVPGADVDSLSGTINADLTAGVLTFSGGSSITADLNPVGPFVPNTLPGVDNYGMVSGILGAAAFRSFTYDIPTGTVTDGAAPSGMDWSASGLVNSAATSGPLTGMDPNSTALLASLTTVGNVETLVLPIYADNGATDIRFIQVGQIVASRVVPEPSTLALLGLAGVAVVAMRRRSSR